MPETPQQYIARIFGYIEGKNPLRVQQSTARVLAKAIKGLDKKRLSKRPANPCSSAIPAGFGSPTKVAENRNFARFLGSFYGPSACG